MLSPVRVAAPAETPVSLAEAKAHLRVDTAGDDARITALIQAATDHFDGWSGILGRALVTQSWRVDMAGFPASRWVRLPLPPVQSITTVAYWDAANADQVFATGNYSLHSDGGGPFIALGNGVSWPPVYRRQDAIRVTFVAGYGAASAVPQPLKVAILLRVEALYATMKDDIALRAESADGVSSQSWADVGGVMESLIKASDALAVPYRIPRI